MVKLAKNVKSQPKQKKMAPPPKDVDDSEEEESSDEEESSEEEMVPQKKAVTPAKAAAVATPNKKAATPGKKIVATPAKKTVATPAKKAATPLKKTPVPAKGAKNGKNAKKEESEDEEDEEEDSEEDEDESEEEPAVPVKKTVQAAGKKPVAAVAAISAKQESEDDEDDEDEEDDESEDEPMEITPAKGKKAVLAKTAPVKVTPAKLAKEDSEDEEDDEEEDDDDEEEEDDDEEEEENVQEMSGKRKKEMAKQKGTPDAKKKKMEETAFSIFMGNLNANKDFEELKVAIKDFFAKKDLEVQEVRIGNSKRFGYVDFSSEADVDKALKLNGKKLLGLEIKLEKAKSRECIQENKKERDARTIFVKNLSYSITQEDLQEVFDNALEVRLVSKDGNSKGIAYIEFKSEAEAEKAMEEKQGMEIEGRAIMLDYTGEKSQQDGRKSSKGAQPGGESKTLVVNNLSYDATEESLQEVFEKAAAIRIPQNNQGRPKGYAFIDFPTTEDAKEAMNSCNNTEIEGRTIRLEFSTPGGQNRNFNARGGFGQQSKTLFVKGLSEETTEETLKESFDGSVGARIVTDRDTGSSKGFGFVDFSSPEEAKAAKEAMEDGEIDGNKVTLDFAKPKGDGPRGGGGGFGRGGRGGRGGGRGGFGGRGGGRGFGGRGGGFRGGRGGGGDHKPQGKKIKFDD